MMINTNLTAMFKLNESHDDYQKVNKVLMYMLGYHDEDITNEVKYFSHTFFKTDNWKTLFNRNVNSFDDCYSHMDALTGTLIVRVATPNEYNELELFLLWIAPYIRNKGIVGEYSTSDSTDNVIIANTNNEYLVIIGNVVVNYYNL